ncbi:MAG: carboxypeptidase regulatory-like domain-containing protein [Candidatus Diapherotrites archaeon]|nr:carboxypeptidase regulatory-like domain-containing protein [Candidatus Diapherotrites archaeon]
MEINGFLKSLAILVTLSILAPAVFSVCKIYTNYGEIDGKFQATVMFICDGFAIPEKEFTIIGPENFKLKAKTDGNGVFAFTPEKVGGYYINVIMDGSTTDSKILVHKRPEITVKRNFNTYKICADVNLGLFKIRDGESTIILLQEPDNCATYVTDSDSFIIIAGGEGFYTENIFKAGKFVRISVPEKIIAGKQFVVRAYDNSEPIEGALIKIGDVEKTTDAEGKATFIFSEPKEMQIVAKKTGLKESSLSIKIEEGQALKLSIPSKISPNQAFEVKVTDGSGPVKGAIVSVGGDKRVTGEDGTALFSVGSSGTYAVKAVKDGFYEGKALLTIGVEKTAIKEMYISIPELMYEGQVLSVIVNSLEGPVKGAKIEINGKEYFTDAEGRARIAGLSAGSYKVKIEKSGFAPTEAKVKIIKSIVEERPVIREDVKIALFIALVCSLGICFIGTYMVWHKRRYGFV